MFSRRHPYLFFVLSFFTIAGGTLVGISLIILVGLRTGGSQAVATDGEPVGIVEITGLISDTKETLADLKRFDEDKSIRAVVVRIDSPGGVVGPTQEIFREISKLGRHKPVVASLGAVAASGGYYVASAADRIMSNPGTVTGSIGVILAYTNLEDLFQKIGLTPVVVKSGKFKDIGSPTRPMSSEERRILQEFVDDTHRQFVQDVARGRKMELSRVEAVADGRIFTGQAAKTMGLVDRLGNLEDAVEWAGRLAGIQGRVRAVYPPKTKYPLLKYLTDSVVQSIIGSALERDWFAAYLYRPPESAIH